MKDGFYKHVANTLAYGATFIHSPNYELRVEQKDTYTFPVDGWYWFDTLEEACSFFNLDIADYQKSPEETSNSVSLNLPPINLPLPSLPNALPLPKQSKP